MLDELLGANARYARTFTAGDLAPPPTRRLAVVTCMDARIDPLAVLGCDIGEAHVMRNAGGRVTEDVIRSLAVSHHVLGVTTVVVMHHTGCGMAVVDDEGMRRHIGDATGQDLAKFEFHAIADPIAAVREDVARVAGSPLLDVEVAGLIYDVHSGTLEPVA